MKTNILILLVTLFYACTNEHEKKSEIVIKLIDFGSLYKYPIEMQRKILKKLDSLEKIKKNDSNDDFLIDLKNNNLLFKPYIYVSNENNDYSVLYLNKSQHSKLAKFNADYLRKEKKIIEIKYLIKEENKKYLICDSILSISEKDGITKEFK